MFLQFCRTSHLSLPFCPLHALFIYFLIPISIILYLLTSSICIIIGGTYSGQILALVRRKTVINSVTIEIDVSEFIAYRIILNEEIHFKIGVSAVSLIIRMNLIFVIGGCNCLVSKLLCHLDHFADRVMKSLGTYR